MRENEEAYSINLIYVSGSVYKNQTIKLAGILVNYTISRTNSYEGFKIIYRFI